MTQDENTYKNLMDSLEAEQPSMRFSKNVMDAIGDMEVAPVGKRYVNPLVVKGIAAVLILCILISIFLVFIDAGSLPEYTNKLPQHFSLYLLGINMVLFLILVERWLSSKKRIQDLQDNA